MLTIILITLFVNMEAARRPSQMGQWATTTFFTTLTYERNQEGPYTDVAKKEVLRQVRKTFIPDWETMYEMNVRNVRGKIALVVRVKNVSCDEVRNMAEEAKTHPLVKSVTVQCGSGQLVTATIFTDVFYEKGHDRQYMEVAKKEIRYQLRRNIKPFLKQLYKVNVRNVGGKFAVVVEMDVPDCRVATIMAKEAKISHPIIKSARVQCGSGPAINI
ncbi:unnamed protein product [Cylicocyclus nassatus]|uniref:Uncharacterized protein n=1 Tax=Cylicocyclus nassatus TaxID=53992 RepID=A0AA36GTM1_CYLNA|nr:unnamed protein product [Cylicocyclus nassatus]